MVNCLARKGIATLQDLGRWKKDGLGKWVFEVVKRHDCETLMEATQRGWDRMEQMMSATEVDWLFEGGEELLSTQIERRCVAEN